MRRQRRRQDDSRDVRVRENIVEGGRRRNIRVGLVDLGAMGRMDIADGFHQAFSAFNKLRQQLFSPVAGADERDGNFGLHDFTCTL